MQEIKNYRLLQLCTKWLNEDNSELEGKNDWNSFFLDLFIWCKAQKNRNSWCSEAPEGNLLQAWSPRQSPGNESRYAGCCTWRGQKTRSSGLHKFWTYEMFRLKMNKVFPLFSVWLRDYYRQCLQVLYNTKKPTNVLVLLQWSWPKQKTVEKHK